MCPLVYVPGWTVPPGTAAGGKRRMGSGYNRDRQVHRVIWWTTTSCVRSRDGQVCCQKYINEFCTFMCVCVCVCVCVCFFFSIPRKLFSSKTKCFIKTAMVDLVGVGMLRISKGPLVTENCGVTDRRTDGRTEAITLLRSKDMRFP